MSDKESYRRHDRHFFTGIFEWRFMLTPVVGKYRCWKFHGNTYRVEYQDIYIFGFRVIRWQL